MELSLITRHEYLYMRERFNRESFHVFGREHIVSASSVLIPQATDRDDFLITPDLSYNPTVWKQGS